MATILIAEPNPKLRKIFTAIIERAGWSAVAGDATPESAKDVNLVIGSLAGSIPETVDAVKALKEIGLPVIYISVLGNPEETADVLHAGADDYLVVSDLSVDLVNERIVAQLKLSSNAKQTTTGFQKLSERWRSLAGIPTELDPVTIRNHLVKIKELEVLSPVAQKLVGMVGSEQTTVRDLVKVISSDPGLASKLLTFANSAFYRGRTPFTSIERAVVRIGFSGVRTLALAISVMDQEDEEDDGKTSFIPRIYDHSVATAALCEALARTSKICAPDKAFLCGLLHDMGKVVINLSFTQQARKILKWTRGRDVPGYRIEQRVLAMDHCRITGRMLDLWQISSEISRPITHHHAPLHGMAGLSPEDKKTATLIYMADNLAKALHFYADSSDHLEYAGFDHAELLNLSPDQIESAVTTAERDVQELRQVLMDGAVPERDVLVKYPPGVLIIRDATPPADILGRFLRHLGCNVSTTESAMTTRDVPPDTVILTMIHDPTKFPAAIERLKGVEGGDRDNFRRHILVGASEIAREDLNEARAMGFCAVAHPVSIAEVVRVIKRAKKNIKTGGSESGD